MSYVVQNPTPYPPRVLALLTTPTYCLVQDVKDRLMLKPDAFGCADDDTFKALISSAICQAEFLIDNYTHRTFKTMTGYVELFDGEWTRSYWPSHGPLLNVTSLEYTNGPGASLPPVWQTVGTPNIDFYVYTWHIEYPQFFYKGYMNYQITYDYGALQTPNPVRIAAIQTAMAIMRYMRLNKMGPVIRFNQGETSGSRGGDVGLATPQQDILTPDVQSMLNPFLHLSAVTMTSPRGWWVK